MRISPAPWAKSSSSGSLNVRNSGATATSANPPSMQNAATRSPAANRAPSGALRTTPPTSLPGTNGSGGLSWYSPRVCSTSGNDTPAAWTSITTPLPGVSMCDGSGSGRSTSFSALAGPESSTIWRARMAATSIVPAGTSCMTTPPPSACSQLRRRACPHRRHRQGPHRPCRHRLLHPAQALSATRHGGPIWSREWTGPFALTPGLSASAGAMPANVLTADSSGRHSVSVSGYSATALSLSSHGHVQGRVRAVGAAQDQRGERRDRARRRDRGDQRGLLAQVRSGRERHRPGDLQLGRPALRQRRCPQGGVAALRVAGDDHAVGEVADTLRAARTMSSTLRPSSLPIR